jgi:hypothetical protein
MTFAQATKDHLQNLKAMGWTVADGLKVPHATSPDKEIRLWFRPQAVWASYNGATSIAAAHSLFVDHRSTSTPALVTMARRFAS